MLNTANQSYLRAINQRSVLSAIFENAPISKAELARKLKLSKPATADNVSHLLKEGIVYEIGEGKGPEGGGRKPILLSFNKNFRYVSTLDFYYLQSIFCLFNLSGEIINSFVVRQTPQHGFVAWMRTSINAVRTLLSSQNITSDKLAAIGISSPGIISADQNIILNGPMFDSFDPQELHNKMIEAFHCPVYIKNSTNASALGEWVNGVGRGTSNMLYLSCGLGLGLGLIINNHLYEGSDVAAGEITNFITPETIHLQSSIEDRICIASLLGTFEKEASQKIISRLKKREEEPVTFGDLVELWQQGDSFMREWVDGLALQLGCVVCNLIMTINCDILVLGGDYLAFQTQIIPYIEKLVQQKCIKPARILPASLQEQGSSIGMSTICREMCFDSFCGVNLSGMH